MKLLENLIRKCETTQPARNQLFIKIDKENLFPLLKKLRKLKARICSITGVDNKKEIEIIYHFSVQCYMVSLKTSLDKKNLKIPTITKIFPGALLFEKELHDMLGVKVKDIGEEMFLLSEDWKGKPPLRKCI